MGDWIFFIVILLIFVGIVIHVLKRKGDKYIQDDPDD